MPPVPRLKKWLRAAFITPLALLVLFEEWGWERLAAGFAVLARLPLWGRLERWIASRPPWAALLLFGVPVLMLLPIKLFALYLFGQGHMAGGLGLILGAKVLGTALAARLFQLTHPTLMTLPWFARLYKPWKRWKDRVLLQLRGSWPWRLGRVLKGRAKRMVDRIRRTFTPGP